MARSRRSLQTAPSQSYHSPRTGAVWYKRKHSFQQWLFDVTIAVLAVLVVGFIVSAISTRSGVELTFTSEELTDRSRLLAVPLATEFKEEGQEPTEDRIVLEVLNGIGISGLANQFTDFLRDQGFDVVRFTNAQRFDYPRTLVINRGDDFEQAQLVARSLGLEAAAVENMPEPSLQLDVTVVLGQDYNTLTSFRVIMSQSR